MREIRKKMMFLVMLFLLMGISGCAKEPMVQPDIVKKLGVGWNLGNTLEVNDSNHYDSVYDYEQAWGNPVVTKEFIQTVADAGFKTIRIPVTWENHIDENGKIDKTWLIRVRKIVDYVLDSGCYAVINAHHDTWYELGSLDYSVAEQQMRNVWGQIGNYFKDYDERLLFEAMNEPRMFASIYEWSGGTAASNKKLNYLNQLFVDIIRKQGGNNKDRYLFIPTYSGSNLLEAFESLEVPEDDHVIVSIHAYTPYNFAMVATETANWDEQNPWDTADVDMCMRRIEHFFTEKGIPAVITEFGVMDKNNMEQRLNWTSYFMEKGREVGITCFWWDGGNTPTGKEYRLFDRETGEVLFPELVDALIKK